MKRPRDEVFEYTADFSNIEQWDPGVVYSRKITRGPVKLGSKFEVEVKFGSSTTPMVYEITEHEPHSRVVLVGTGEKLTAVDEIEFGNHDNMTSIEYKADLTFHNYFRFLGPLIAPALRKVGEEALDGLSEQLDS